LNLKGHSINSPGSSPVIGKHPLKKVSIVSRSSSRACSRASSLQLESDKVMDQDMSSSSSSSEEHGSSEDYVRISNLFSMQSNQIKSCLFMINNQIKSCLFMIKNDHYSFDSTKVSYFM
jgi:hypothetical protein